MLNMKHLGICAALLLSYSGIAYGQERTDVMALQHALLQKGHYEGAVDGLMGPATRNAMSVYAAGQDIDQDFWSIAQSISKNIDWEVEWKDSYEESLAAALDTYLADSESARINQRRIFRNSNDNLSACFLVNARNTFGAYVGYQWIHMPAILIKENALLRLDETIHFVAPPSNMTSDVAAVWCSLGFVLEGT